MGGDSVRWFTRDGNRHSRHQRRPRRVPGPVRRRGVPWRAAEDAARGRGGPERVRVDPARLVLPGGAGCDAGRLERGAVRAGGREQYTAEPLAAAVRPIAVRAISRR